MGTKAKTQKMRAFKRIDPKMPGTIPELMVAEGYLNGQSKSEIAKSVSKRIGQKLSPDTVTKILNKDAIQQIISEQSSRLVKLLPTATNNLVSAVESFSDKKLSPDDKKIAWDATKEVHKALGTLANNYQSYVHVTNINQQNNVVIHPVIADLMKKHYGGLIDLKTVTGGENVCAEEEEEERGR